MLTYIPITIVTDEIIPVNVMCGPCGTEITDITFVQTLPLIES